MTNGLETLSEITVWGKYAKYLPEEHRRENWEEIVSRYLKMMQKKYPILEKEINEKGNFILDKKILPSMRMMQFSGKAIEVNHARGYNCAFLPIDHYTSFSEVMFLLLGGTGVGYSVQNIHINKLPVIKKSLGKRRYLISDDIQGWADSIKVLMKWAFGLSSRPIFDYSDIRAKGVRLVTAGGKAPGPEPLKICHAHIFSIIDGINDDQNLSSLECHDINCHIANAVLAGGIRRSAMIAGFDIEDEKMLTSKFGAWWETNEQRGRANNSAILERSIITEEKFKELWEKIETSNSGEPGFYLSNDTDWFTNPCCFTGDMRLLTSEGYKSFNSLNNNEGIAFNKDMELVPFKVWSNGIKQVIKLNFSDGNYLKCTPDHKLMDSKGNTIEAKDSLGKLLFRLQNIISIDTIPDEEVFDFNLEGETHWGIVEEVIAHNCEIALRPYQMCNLCELNFSTVENQEDFNERVQAASFFGTLQAGFTDFYYLREIWGKTCRKDALLGIGITGLASSKIFEIDFELAVKEYAIKTNKEISEIIGINPAARITCVKPSGTTSLVLGTSSGIHDWHSKYYLRTMRFGKEEAITSYLLINNPSIIEPRYFKISRYLLCKNTRKSPRRSYFKRNYIRNRFIRTNKTYI
jgi:intein/homing endonuclease